MEGTIEGERIYGDGVSIAARLERLAEPGGICVSGTVHDQVENKLTFSYEYRGEQTLPYKDQTVLERALAAPRKTGLK